MSYWVNLLFHFSELMQIPEAAQASQTIIIGFADMFLPSILIEGVQNDITGFAIRGT